MEEITADQSELKRTRDAKQVDGGGKEVKKNQPRRREKKRDADGIFSSSRV